MPPNDEAERWRLLAAEAFDVAREMTDADSKAIMLHIAAAYQRLAERAEKVLDAILDATSPLLPSPVGGARSVQSARVRE